eukprot:m.169521 g.169521  ORF g.169521 m.169521 type:complete len:1013 (-) comp21196_c0_seq2:23-3061(-)
MDLPPEVKASLRRAEAAQGKGDLSLAYALYEEALEALINQVMPATSDHQAKTAYFMVAEDIMSRAAGIKDQIKTQKEGTATVPPVPPRPAAPASDPSTYDEVRADGRPSVPSRPSLSHMQTPAARPPSYVQPELGTGMGYGDDGRGPVFHQYEDVGDPVPPCAQQPPPQPPPQQPPQQPAAQSAQQPPPLPPRPGTRERKAQDRKCGTCNAGLDGFWRRSSFLCLFCRAKFCDDCILSSDSRLWLMEDGTHQNGFCCKRCMTERERMQRERLQILNQHAQSAAQQAAQQQQLNQLMTSQLEEERRRKEQAELAASQSQQRVSAIDSEHQRQQEDKRQLDQLVARLRDLGFQDLESRIVLAEVKKDYDEAVRILTERQQAMKVVERRAAGSFTIPVRRLDEFQVGDQLDRSGNTFLVSDAREPTDKAVMCRIPKEKAAAVQSRLTALIELCNEHRSTAVPYVVPVSAVCWAQEECFLCSPLLSAAMSLRDWMAQPRSKNDIKTVFSHIVQGVSMLHSKDQAGLCTMNGALVYPSVDGPEGILVHSFDVSKDSPQPPEVQAGDAWSQASDMYAFGCLLHFAHFQKMPVLMPDADSVSLPFGVDLRLRDLLEEHLLRANPQERSTALQAQMHPYFTTSEFFVCKESGMIVETSEKVCVLKEMTQLLTEQHTRRRLQLRVNRMHIVDTVCDQIMTASSEDLCGKMAVTFEGEQGIDAGGLTIEMYNQFFNALLRPLPGEQGLFEASARGSKYLPSEDSTCEPHMMDYRRRLFSGIGRVLIKAVFDAVEVPLPLCPSVFKFLLDKEPSLLDLESYDADLASHLRQVLSMEDAANLGMDFSDVLKGSEGDVMVTNENRQSYVNMMVKKVLVTSRLDALKALKEGFESIRICKPLRLFSSTELMEIIQGQEDIKPEAVLVLSGFTGFPASSKTPEYVRKFIQGLSRDDLCKLLCFVTASPTLPHQPIVFHGTADPPQAYPCAHTCFRRLDLPDYNSPQLVEQRLRYCLDHLQECGFGVA